MRKEKILFFTGILLIIIPFLGFPETIRKILIVIGGVSVSLMAYFLVKAKKQSRGFPFIFPSDESNTDPSTPSA